MNEPVYMTQIVMKTKATEPEHLETKETVDAVKVSVDALEEALEALGDDLKALTAADIGAAAATHTHAVGDVDGLEDALDAKADASALDEYVKTDVLDTTLGDYAKTADVESAIDDAVTGLVTTDELEAAVEEAIETADIDLTNYVTKDDLADAVAEAVTDVTVNPPDLAGYVTEDELETALDGLHGEKGDPGADGKDGVDGVDGVDGEKGDKGDKGESGDEFMMVPDFTARITVPCANLLPTSLTAGADTLGPPYTVPEDGFVAFSGNINTSTSVGNIYAGLKVNDVFVPSYSESIFQLPANPNRYRYVSAVLPVRKGDIVNVSIWCGTACDVSSNVGVFTFYPAKAVPPKFQVFDDKGTVATRADLPASAADFDMYHITDEHQDVYARYVRGLLTWQPVRAVNSIESAVVPDYAKRTVLAPFSDAFFPVLTPADGAAKTVYGTVYTVLEDGFVAFSAAWKTSLDASSFSFDPAVVINGITVWHARTNLVTNTSPPMPAFNIVGPFPVKAGDVLRCGLYSHNSQTATKESWPMGLVFYPIRSLVADPAAAAFNSHVADQDIHITSAQRDKWDRLVDAAQAAIDDSVADTVADALAEALVDYAPMDDVEDMLADKADASALTNLPTKADMDAALADKVDTSVLGDYLTEAEIDEAMAYKADLVSGKIPASQLPAGVFEDFWSVATADDLITLTDAQKGNHALITTGDEKGHQYILSALPATDADNWVLLEGGNDCAVLSVNNKTGVVEIDLPDLPGVQAALDDKASSADLDDLAETIPGVKLYKGTVTGDGSTVEFVVAHSLGTKDVIVQARDAAGDMVVFGVTASSDAAVKLTTAVAPASGEVYSVVIMGIAG